MKNYKNSGAVICFILGLSQLLTAQWVQLGDTITGSTINIAFGYRTSVSDDGNRLAVGIPYDDSAASSAGMVKVYDWDGVHWVQAGSSLSGTIINDQFGQEVEISGDGTHLAVGYKNFSQNHPGRVRVYTLQNNNWVQIGQDLNGMVSGEQFGIALDMSFDGKRLAIGSQASDVGGNMSGQLTMYEFNGTMWVKRGLSIKGTEIEMRKGAAVALSEDGNTVVAGSLSDQWANVEVFSFDGSHWVNKGAAIPGLGRFGYGVDISADGNRLAAAGYLFPNFALGYVRVYDFVNGEWTQVGSDIVGEEEGAYFGFSLQMSTDGNTIALGAPGSDALAEDGGQIKVFRYQTNDWVQYGESINGSSQDKRYGDALSISGNGKRIFCSSSIANTSTGEVVVFENQTVGVHEYDLNKETMRILPNPTTGVFAITPEISEYANIQIFNLNGMLLKENTRDISDLAEGVYWLQVQTSQKTFVKKIIKLR